MKILAGTRAIMCVLGGLIFGGVLGAAESSPADRKSPELRPLRDAAHSGQGSSFSKTQGGADACPGLVDVAPSADISEGLLILHPTIRILIGRVCVGFKRLIKYGACCLRIIYVLEGAFTVCSQLNLEYVFLRFLSS
jgi:hypothetical protein